MINIWAAEWHSRNYLDEYTPLFLYEKCLPVLFKTRRECRAYIAERQDLRDEPNRWRMAKAVKVAFAYDSSGRY